MSQKVEKKKKIQRNTFDVDEELEDQLSIQDLKRVTTYIKPYRGKLIKALIVVLIANISTLLGPFIVMQAIDVAIPSGEVNYLILLSAFFVATLIITAICARIRIRTINALGQNVLYDIRLDIFSHLQKLPFDFYDSRPHGKILIRVVNYINTLSELLSGGLINLISDVLSLFLALGFMFFINVRFTLFSLLFVPVLMAIIFAIKHAQRHAFQTLSNKQSNMNAYIHESIAGIKVSQSFVREEENTEIFERVQTEYRTSWLKAVQIMFLVHPSVQIIQVSSTVMIYWLGARAIGAEVVTLGVVVAFIGYLMSFWGPIVNIGNFYNTLITGSAYLERIFETIDEDPVVKDAPDASMMPEIKGEVIFDNVEFGYEEKLILKGLNFKVEPGQSIALVGPTGAGKSTIINLLSRFYNLNGGRILIDGTDISGVTLNSLRSQMGVMLQDTFIFSGTIKENIRYGKLDATDEEIEQAAKAVMAHEFIMKQKDGYDTELAERGSNLSAGQRQLLSFARTLLANPKILILDEATSSIDTKTEALLQKALEVVLEGRTSFIIAHRLLTIKNADQIFYINNGVLEESGNHDELMANPESYYRKLHESQFAGV